VSQSLFITGTDTGVGKTYVTAAVLAELRRRGVRAAAFKPIACGTGGRHDAEIYARLMDHEQPINVVNPVYLKHPLAPSVAARLERKPIDIRRIQRAYKLLAAKYSIVLVEGAGGLMVPIRQNYFVADLVASLKLPLVIIARLGLGTINHSMLTLRAARERGLTVRGIVLNDTVGGRRGLASKTNIETVPELCLVPFLGVMPHGKNGMPKAARQICDELMKGK
jgi:dethiobiotin synthetase